MHPFTCQSLNKCLNVFNRCLQVISIRFGEIGSGISDSHISSRLVTSYSIASLLVSIVCHASYLKLIHAFCWTVSDILAFSAQIPYWAWLRQILFMISATCYCVTFYWHLFIIVVFIMIESKTCIYTGFCTIHCQPAIWE